MRVIWDDIAFALEYRVENDAVMDFELFEIDWVEGGTEGTKYGLESVLTGHMKWDDCINFETTQVAHLCGGFSDFIEALTRIEKLKTELLPTLPA